MGQQPNIELHHNDLPRAQLAPGPARAWRPRRPGELTSPADFRFGGRFGAIGPDAGYALKLAAGAEMNLLPGEHRHDAVAAVAAIASARAAAEGRAPVADDVVIGMIVLGLDGQAKVDSAVLAKRPRWIANVAHDATKLRGIVADVPADLLALTPEQLRAEVASGWHFRNEGGAP